MAYLFFQEKYVLSFYGELIDDWLAMSENILPFNTQINQAKALTVIMICKN